MWILDNGNVGIGFAYPAEKLAVNGSIRSRDVIVETSNWPDYVFEPSYKLPTLKEIKSYIDRKHHLPEVPSEKEILENGHNLGELNKLMMKKVEELTLYLIEQDEYQRKQDKKLADQQRQIDRLSKSLKVVRKRIK